MRFLDRHVRGRRARGAATRRVTVQEGNGDGRWRARGGVAAGRRAAAGRCRSAPAALRRRARQRGRRRARATAHWTRHRAPPARPRTSRASRSLRARDRARGGERQRRRAPLRRRARRHGDLRPARRARAAEAGEQEVRFALYPQDWRFAPGHRIALRLSGSDDAWFSPGLSQTDVEVLGGSLTLPLLRAARARGSSRAARPTGWTTTSPFALPAETIAEAEVGGDMPRRSAAGASGVSARRVVIVMRSPAARHPRRRAARRAPAAATSATPARRSATQVAEHRVPRGRRARARRRAALARRQPGRRGATRVGRAHAYQRRLGDSVPLRNAPWFGTHNSFNSIAEMGPAVSVMDSNQQLSLVEQLRVDVRSLELDLHWFPSASTGGAMAPVVCHAQGERRLLGREAARRRRCAPIGDWLRAHPRRDRSSSTSRTSSRARRAGRRGGRDVEERDRRPRLPPAGAAGSASSCRWTATRNDVRAAGKQVVLVGNCGSARARGAGSSTAGRAHEETPPAAASPATPTSTRRRYDATIIRYFEDDTWLTSAASNVGASSRDDGSTRATTRRCCAAASTSSASTSSARDATTRHGAAVWSWDEGEPTNAACAVMEPTRRWESRSPCRARPFACISASARPTFRKVRGRGHAAAEGLRDAAHGLRERARPPGRSPGATPGCRCRADALARDVARP